MPVTNALADAHFSNHCYYSEEKWQKKDTLTRESVTYAIVAYSLRLHCRFYLFLFAKL